MLFFSMFVKDSAKVVVVDQQQSILKWVMSVSIMLRVILQIIQSRLQQGTYRMEAKIYH